MCDEDRRSRILITKGIALHDVSRDPDGDSSKPNAAVDGGAAAMPPARARSPPRATRSGCRAARGLRRPCMHVGHRRVELLRSADRPPHCRRRACTCISGWLAGGSRSAKRARSCNSAARVSQLMRATGEPHSTSSRSPTGGAATGSQVAARASSALAKTQAAAAVAAAAGIRSRIVGHGPALNRRRRAGLRAPAAAGPRRRADCRRTSP